MIDTEKRKLNDEKKERTRKRIRVAIDKDNYEYFPAKKPEHDYYDNDTNQRVAIYVRVSTDNISQTTSFELQKKYYEDFVQKHPNWTLVKIYADEGVSGTSLKNRIEFQEMITDCKAGKIDLIITKSVSRFARDVMICIGMVRDLAELKPPVGVFFESECIFSLNNDSQMALTFLSTMAEEESRTRSRSMESSLRMRLDNGIPLTPKLLGYLHDEDGKLIINPDEAPTVKLIFYMYLYGYSTQQIADTLTALERKSYFGRTHWTASVITQVLRNERHCGDVLTRKTYTPNFRTHKSVKNNGERPKSHYKDHHEAIISRDDYIAVQRMLDNAKYGNRAFLPELKIIDSGIFKGYIIINPKWAGFTLRDYHSAAQSAYAPSEENSENEETSQDKAIIISVDEGEFDMRGFEIARGELFDTVHRPFVTFANKKITFSTNCIRQLAEKNYVELLINPIEGKFAIRPTDKSNRRGVLCSKHSDGKTYKPREIPATAFFDTLYEIFGWNTDYKYRILGSCYKTEEETAFIFNVGNSQAFLKSYMFSTQTTAENGELLSIAPLTPSGKRIRAVPESWTSNFGEQYYLHEETLQALSEQSEEDWKLKIEGRFFNTGNKLNVTGFDTLKQYIMQELSEINIAGAN